MTQERITRLSTKFDSQTCLEILVSPFLKSFQCQPSDLIFLQHLASNELKQRLKNDELNQVLLLIVDLYRSNQFHCATLFHELFLKILDSEDELLCFDLFQQNNFELWNSFPKICDIHCSCTSLKFLRKLISFTLLKKEALRCDMYILEAIQSYFSSDTYCIAQEWLHLATYLLSENISNQLPQVTNHLKQSTKAIFDSYLIHFQTSKDFTGNVWNPELVITNESANSKSNFEHKYDLALIRSYLILFLQTTLPEEFRQLTDHLDELRLSLGEDSSGMCNIDWLIEIFIAEDSDLFTMLRLTVLLFGSQPQTNGYFVHRLFHQFLVSIDFDAGVLLQMLRTGHDTGTTFLHFLLAYLKIPPFPNHESIDIGPVISKIKQTLSELKTQITDHQDTFPYNPGPLLRRLNSL